MVWQAGWAEGGPVATVKLVLETGVGVITRAWPLNQPLHALRTQLSHTTQVPAQYVQVRLSDPRGRVGSARKAPLSLAPGCAWPCWWREQPSTHLLSYNAE